MKQRIAELWAHGRERLSVSWQREDAWSPFDAQADEKWRRGLEAVAASAVASAGAFGRWRQSLTPRTLRAAGIVLMVAALGTAAYAIMGSLTKNRAVAPFTLVEVRAVDQAGHPVAGATVEVNGKAQGVSDSFGEWRRFLRVKSRTVGLRIFKAQGDGYLAGHKVLPLGAAKGGSPAEAVASVTLLPRGSLPPLGARDGVGDGVGDFDEPGDVAETWDAASGVGATSWQPGLKATPGESAKRASPAAPPATPERAFEPTLRVALRHAPVSGPDPLAPLLPRLKELLGAKGIVLDPESPLVLTLGLLKRGGKADMVEMVLGPRSGDSLLSGMVASHDASGDQFLHAAAAFLDAHNTPGVRAVRENGRWLFRVPRDDSQRVPFANGDVFEDPMGQEFVVTGGALRHDSLVVALATGGKSPCGGQDEGPCYLRRRRPGGAEKRMRVKIQGLAGAAWRQAEPRAAAGKPRVYVAGRLARAMPDQTWEFRATPSQEAFVTLVQDDVITGRERIIPSRYRVPQLTVGTGGALRQKKAF